MIPAAPDVPGSCPNLLAEPFAEALSSWRAMIGKTLVDKSVAFAEAAIEVWELIDRYAPDDRERQDIIDALDAIGEAAGLSPDDRQAIMHRTGQEVQRDAAQQEADIIRRWEKNDPSNGHAFDDGSPPPNPDDYGGTSGAEVEERPKRPPMTIAEWAERNLPDPDFILGNWLSTTCRVVLNAATGIGKTNFALALAMHVAAGRDFLHWRGRRKCRVLYIDGEMSRRLLKQRIADAAQRLGEVPEGFHAVSHEDIENFAPLNTPAGQKQIEHLIEQIGGVDLVVFDSVMCLMVGDMKDEEGWAMALPWIRSLTRRNIGQIWVHHTGHNETRGYGTSTREWQVDTVIILQAHGRADTDVSFALEFKKARERTPITRHEFQDIRVALVNDRWEYQANETGPAGHVSPLGLKFLDALKNVLASGVEIRVRGRAAAPTAAWKAECATLGLLDLTKENSARTLFSKHRRELIAANRIACDDDHTWTL